MLARSRSVFYLCAIAGIALATSPAHVLGAGLERKVPRQLAEPCAACPTALEHQLPLPSVLGEGKHAEFQKAHPEDDEGRHITNPEDLTHKARTDICSQCHGGGGKLLGRP